MLTLALQLQKPERMLVTCMRLRSFSEGSNMMREGNRTAHFATDVFPISSPSYATKSLFQILLRVPEQVTEDEYSYHTSSKLDMKK